MDVDYFLYESSVDSTFYFNNDDLNYSSYNISKLEIESENEGEFDYLINEKTDFCFDENKNNIILDSEEKINDLYKETKLDIFYKKKENKHHHSNREKKNNKEGKTKVYKSFNFNLNEGNIQMKYINYLNKKRMRNKI